MRDVPTSSALSKPHALSVPLASLEKSALDEPPPLELQPARSATDAVIASVARAVCLLFIRFPFDGVATGVVARAKRSVSRRRGAKRQTWKPSHIAK